jgi:hypothetical protein
MQNQIALESLIQKGKSEFYKSVESLCHEAQMALQQADILSDSDVLYHLNKMNYTTKLLAVIQQFMKTPITAVVLKKTAEPGLYCVLRANNNISNYRKSKMTEGMAMSKLEYLYDDRKGEMREPLDASTESFKFAILINTGIWSIRNSKGDFYLTSGEIAASILHEVGHIDHFIRTAFRVQQQNLDASDIVDYISVSHDPVVIRALIDTLKKSRQIGASWRPVLNQVETYFATSNNTDDPYYWEALSTLSVLVAAVQAGNNVRSYNDLIGVSSAYVRTHTQTVDAERSADEFSVRHGSYADLSSAMIKLNQLAGPGFKAFYYQATGHELATTVSLMHTFKQIFGVSLEEIDGGYDPILRRVELMLETAKHAFRNQDLTSEEQADIKIQISQIEQYLIDMRKDNRRKVRMALKTWKSDIGKFGRLIKAPFETRLSKDYGRLQEATRALARNPLYYLAKK